MQNRVKQVIESKAFTSSRFADHIGVPRATISHILSGRNKPSLEVVQKILDAFPDISAEWLVKGKGTFGKSAPSLFEPGDFNENAHRGTDAPANKMETMIKAGDNVKKREEATKKEVFYPTDSTDNESLNAKEQRQNAPLTAQDNKAKKSVKIIIMYADGTYSEHSPSA